VGDQGRAHASLVSIVMPSSNLAPSLCHTIWNVGAQNWNRVGHMIVDGGSTARTVEILREYAARYPDCFLCVSGRNRGQSHTPTKGIVMACGEVIGWQANVSRMATPVGTTLRSLDAGICQCTEEWRCM